MGGNLHAKKTSVVSVEPLREVFPEYDCEEEGEEEDGEEGEAGALGEEGETGLAGAAGEAGADVHRKTCHAGAHLTIILLN